MTMDVIDDLRLLAARDLLASGRIRLLSVDVFDTILFRRVPKPTDVFLRLGVLLRDRGKLGVGQSPDSFAAIRYQTEYAARDAQQRRHGNREVTLAEIYASFPPHAVAATATELAAAEIAVEHELCFADKNMLRLTEFAKQKGIALALISNTYFSEVDLKNLLQAKAPGMPAPDAFFVSSEHRCGKRDGLMQKMIGRFKVKPVECLHVGDNSVSDRDVAAKLGIPYVHLDHDEDDFSARLGEEHPVQWHERAMRYAEGDGDGGLSWLRRRMAYRPMPDLSESDREFYVYGAQMLGPLLSGFAGWVGARARAEKVGKIFGIAREGGLLTELVAKLDPEIKCAVLATSRMASALASFAPDYPQHLEDFLTRRGHWTLGALMEQLGFDEKQAKSIGSPEALLETLTPRGLAQALLASPLADDLFQRGAERRARLLKYLKKIGALENGKLFLLDLGYAATIQRALQRIFTIEEIDITTHGFYMVSAHVSLATQAAGGVVEGFLAQNGNPNDFARAFCRSPEVVELSCMPSYGTVTGHDADGGVVYANDTVPGRQGNEVALVQRGIRDFAGLFRDLTAAAPVAPDYTSDSWRAQMRDVATRLVAYPSPTEAKRVGHWLADSDLGLGSPRPIVSSGSHAASIAAMTAEEIVALPRRDVPWLYGVAACLDNAYARQVASLMLRKEQPAAFVATRSAPAPEELIRKHLEKEIIG